jgi:phage gp16-like protein
MMDRNRAIAAIHVGKKAAGLDDDSYRDLMQRETGKRSSAELDERGLRRMLTVLDGLKPADAPRSSHAARKDSRPIARKAVALWLMLWNLDEVRSRHDRAIDAFVQRTTGKAALKFTTNGEAGKVVEALKDWCARSGVDLDRGRHPELPLALLVSEQVRRLGDHDAQLLPPFMPRLQSVGALPPKEMQELANELGSLMRKHRLGKRHKPTPSNEGNDNGKSAGTTDAGA